MSHSTVLVVLPDSAVADTDIETALEAALEPFDENRETAAYIKHTKAALIENQRAEYIRYRDEGPYAEYLKDKAAFLTRTYKRLEFQRYVTVEFPADIMPHLDDDAFMYMKATEWDKDSLDDDGNLLSTYNPKSKWDWYTIGGRWTGSVMNWTDTVHHPAEKRSDTWTTEAWDEKVGGSDIVQKKDLEQFSGTFAFLSADGEWKERGRMGWFGMVADEQDPDEWDATLKQLVEDVADNDWLVVVDVHI